MRLAPFAAMESRTNTAVFQHLANAAGVLAGEPVQGIYDGAYAMALDIAGASIRFTLPTTSVPTVWEDKPLQILAGQGVGNYTVRNHEPDGTGMSILILERAP